MDARPKSNKQKRIESKLKSERKTQRQAQESPATLAAVQAALAERALKHSKAARGNFEERLRLIFRGETVPTPPNSDLAAIAGLFRGVKPTNPNAFPLRPDLIAFRRLVLFCRERTALLTRRDAPQFAAALLALSAHAGRWVRSPETWDPRSHNPYRQFHSLVRHLTARYDVPTFLNSAWLEGLTMPGVVHQRWFLHVAQGQNIRTADRLPVALSRKQAHLFLQAPADFDLLGAFRWAQVRDLGGDERLVRSILATRLATDFARDDFWVTVLRWLVAHPLLDVVHHGPIIDYLHNQRFIPGVPNPLAHRPGQPLLVAPQPNLAMKGRDPGTLLAAVERWHRLLGRSRSARVTTWAPIGLPTFNFEEGRSENRRNYAITELLDSGELETEGRAMRHCVGSYDASCVARRASIWSLRVTDAFGQETRLLTLEVSPQSGTIVQARQKCNAAPSPKEIDILRRWADAGGPRLARWLHP